MEQYSMNTQDSSAEGSGPQLGGRDMEQRAQQAQKGEAIGRLSAGIAHDFNNILAGVMGYAELALTHCEGGDLDELANCLRQIHRAGERGRDMVVQMLSLCCPEAAAGAEAAMGAQTPANPAAGRVLLVDDEPALLALIEDMLTAEGFTVSAYSDGAKALAEFQRDPRGFDLVITDLTMPGLSGTELAIQVRTLRPDIPVLLCTGHNGGLNPEAPPEQAPCGFLAKPYDRLALLARIGGLLDAPRKEAAP
jgi:CheY-like chemotaxis protein